MENKVKAKKEFILDCCDKMKSSLKDYSSETDIYLAAYFAIKKRRGPHVGSLCSKFVKSEISDRYAPPPYYKIPPVPSKSPSNMLLLSSREHKENMISSEDFKKLLQKHREIS